MPEVKVAETAGFCFGVDRAVKKVYSEALVHKTVTYGPIIHNPNVVRDLEKRGVRVINDIKDAKADECIVIRSHGVSKNEYEKIKQHGLFVDATCPYVKKIHNIVERESLEGNDIIIFGDRNHPEVQGIVGYCQTNAYIFGDDNDFQIYFQKNNKNIKKKVAIVAQTTYNIRIWDRCIKVANENLESPQIYDTICSATANRQTEAVELAEQSDLMIIIGGRHSSNTVKLYDMCSNICRCYLIEDARELCGIDFYNADSVGITAGASTPAYIIKEVQRQMAMNENNFVEDINFEEALEQSFKKIHNGERVKGYIAAVNNSEAIVDVGTKHTGYVPLSELTDDPTLKPSDIVKVGDEVELIVVKINDQDGIVTLSKKRIDAMIGFENIVKAKEEDSILEGIVTNVIKGGILVSTNGVKIFIPASQATMHRDDKLEELLKKTVKFKILDVNEQRGRAVGSIKAVAKSERDEAEKKFWDTVNVGDVFKGEVKSVTNYGAFVDLGGIDGMVHISELSWNRIKHPSEIVNVGDVIEVFVKELDSEKKRISLGYKKSEDNPWEKFLKDYHAGDVVKAEVVSITPFGAFAQIIPGIDGLIHISQIADKRVDNVKDVLSVGQSVDVKITEIDEEKKRISISMRALLEDSDSYSNDGE